VHLGLYFLVFELDEFVVRISAAVEICEDFQSLLLAPVVDQPASEVAVDPYGPESPDFVVGEDFARMWTSALAYCHGRFEGKGSLFSREPSGGIGCFTPDSFPVFDTFRNNAYVIADSNHGYKMIGVGALVAKKQDRGEE